jgi:pantothenate kinase
MSVASTVEIRMITAKLWRIISTILIEIIVKFLNLNKHDCYCCKSLTCINEWCPSFTFINLLLEQLEVKFMNSYSSNLVYRYIKDTYDKLFFKLPPDIVLNIIDLL